MAKTLQLILDWSEVWALLIPLIILSFYNRHSSYLNPVIIYLWIALILNLTGNFIADFKKLLPGWLQSNNPLYNIHSIVRFTCFSFFFIALQQPVFTKVKKVIPVVGFFLFMINFTFFEDFFYTNHLSGNLLSGEAYLLLIYCLLYYLSLLRSDVDIFTGSPDFWIATGLCIYVVINFFVFLFYVPMINQNWKVADKMWSVHNVAYIILSISIAKAFYVSAGNKYRI